MKTACRLCADICSTSGENLGGVLTAINTYLADYPGHTGTNESAIIQVRAACAESTGVSVCSFSSHAYSTSKLTRDILQYRRSAL